MSDPVPSIKDKIEWYKAFGESTSEQLEWFRVITELNPDCVWIAAEVDRYDGLVLHRRMEGTSGKRIAVRFPTAKCGYKGSGPDCAIEILTLAGFGLVELIALEVINQEKCLFLLES